MRQDVYDYVKTYFQKNFSEYYLIFKKDGLQYAHRRYLEIVRDEIVDKYNTSSIISGEVDEKIEEKLNEYVNEYFTVAQRKDYILLCEYVNDILMKRGYNGNFSEDIFDYVVKLVSSDLWPQYQISRLNTNEFNSLVFLKYNEVYNQLVEQINRKVNGLIKIKQIDKNTMFGAISLEESVIDDILYNENRDFLRKLNSLVIDKNVELTDTGKKVYRYIRNYSTMNLEPKVKEESISQKKNDVKVTQGITVDRNNILNNMRNNSVKKEHVSSKIKVKSEKKKFSKTIITLAILGTLVGVGVGSIVIDNHIQKVNDNYAIMRVDTVDGFDYGRSYFRNDDYYENMAENVISFYSKTDQLDNENYKMLALYNANEGYENGLKLSEMEKLFGLVKNKIVEDDVNLNIRNVVKADDKKIYCYLDFVYDRLNELGVDEINSKKYQDILLRYKYANYGNYYGVVGVNLSDEENKIINDLVNQYYEYCRQWKIELGYLMQDASYSFFPSYTGSSGKGM